MILLIFNALQVMGSLAMAAFIGVGAASNYSIFIPKSAYQM